MDVLEIKEWCWSYLGKSVLRVDDEQTSLATAALWIAEVCELGKEVNRKMPCAPSPTTTSFFFTSGLREDEAG